MNGLRAARVASTSAVAAVAAWSSWSHMVHVALRYGEHPEVAYALPVSVDGMLIVASTAMVEDRRAGRKVRTSARLAFWIGVFASVAANIDAARPNVGARIVAGWPALALLLVVEMLGRRGRGEAEVPEVPALQQAEVPLAPTAEVPAAPEPEVSSTTPTRRTRRKAEVPEVAATTRPARTARKRLAAAELAALARNLMQEQPTLTQAEVANQLGVTDRRVRQVLAEA